MSETAPLLRDTDDEEAALDNDTISNPTNLSARIINIIQEPLTPLIVVLLFVSLVFLLLSSIFIGLFAGAQHKISTTPPVQTTVTYTQTITSVKTSVTASPTTITMTVPVPTPTSAPKEEPCLTPDCVILAAQYLSSIDATQDPCENFYDYAVGGWIKSHTLPADKSRTGAFDQLSTENKQILRSILEANPAAVSSPLSYDDRVLNKLRSMYTSCMDEAHIESLGAAPLQEFVKTIRKLFRNEATVVDGNLQAPAQVVMSLTKGENKTKGLTAALAFVHSRGIGALFNFGVEGDAGRDPNFMTLQFEQASLGLPSKEYYEEKSVRKVYLNVIKRLLLCLPEDSEAIAPPNRTLTVNVPGKQAISVWPPWPWPPWDDDEPGDDKDDDPKTGNWTLDAHELARKVIAFETEVAQATLDLDVLESNPFAIYNPVSFANFSATVAAINFPDYFATFTPRNFPATIVVNSPAYAANISSILDKTNSSVIEAYLIIRAALQLAPNLGHSTEAWQAVRTLTEALTGIKKGAVPDRPEYCVGKTEEALGFAAGRYFVEEAFSGSSRDKGTRIIHGIIQAFKTSLQGIPWMDNTSAIAAAHKADTLRVKVGYPLSPNTSDPRSLYYYYGTVKILNNTFFDNVVNAASSDVYKLWQKLGKQRNTDEFDMFPSIVNAYFNPPGNEIVFPAGIMRPPFFSKDWPPYIAYPAFGMVAAHELTHAFDSTGRMFNAEGKLETWWTNATSEGYNKILTCIVDQYANYTVDDGKGGEVHLNGNLTSGENIGDSGLIQTWRAWQAQRSASSKDEYLLPGLTHYTREQMFFLSFGRIWAQRRTPASAVSAVRSDPHSPAKFRVEGTLRNMKEFAEVWKCPVGSKLNPPDKERCIFW